MARRPRDARIETREARSRLKRREEPYWRQITPGLAVGYHKGARGGVWRIREYRDGKYRKGRLAKADDYADSDGNTVFSYGQAVAAAMEWGKREDTPVNSTVQDVTRTYMDWHKAHSRNWKSTKYVIKAIDEQFGRRSVSDLTPQSIQRWHLNLAKTDEDDPEVIRKKKATANRNLTVLKAALNHAWNSGMIGSIDSWRRVKPFQDVDAPRLRFLTQVECKQLINASPPDLRQLVRSALLTGCRYGELARLRMADFNEDAGTVTISQTKGKKTRHVPLTDEGRDFFTHAVLGLEHDDRIFCREGGQPWKKSNQMRPMKAASEAAKIKPVVSFHVLRHTYGSLLAKNSVPLQVIAAAMGHSDTRMTEKHYAHLRPDHVALMIRKNLPRFERKRRTKKAS